MKRTLFNLSFVIVCGLIVLDALGRFEEHVDVVYKRSKETALHAFYYGCVTDGAFYRNSPGFEVPEGDNLSDRCKATAEEYILRAFPDREDFEGSHGG